MSDEASATTLSGWRWRQIADHVVAAALITLAELVLILWLTGINLFPPPDSLLRNGGWFAADDRRIGWMRADEASGRFPYPVWDEPTLSRYEFCVLWHHTYRGDPTFMAVSAVLVPYWLIVLILLVFTVLAVRRAGVVLPRTWLRSLDGRRGFEPIMTWPGDTAGSDGLSRERRDVL